MAFSRRVLIAAVATTVMLISAGAAMAHGYNSNTMNILVPESHSYSGSWPVTVSRSEHGDGTSCLTLTGTSKNGGSASLVSGSAKFPYGTFQIFNHTLVATIQAQGYGQNAGLVFIGSANRGNIGPGVFDEVYGGEAFVEGALAFGMKGGC
jgi:hypothetical protein